MINTLAQSATEIKNGLGYGASAVVLVMITFLGTVAVFLSFLAVRSSWRR